MASLGAEVTVVARSEDKLKSVVEGMDISHGQSHKYLVVDFLNPDALGEAIEGIVSESAPIHIVVNNAGGPKGGPIIESGLQDFANAFTMHLLCYQKLAQLLIPGMKDAGYGRVINVISTSVKQPIQNLGVSNTIRAAVANWSKTLANEVGGYGITVNNVLPGYTKTERLDELVNMRANMAGVSPDEMLKRLNSDVPANRAAEPEEIAYAAAFLAGPSASFISGSNIIVDGGKTKSL
jgi:3-oxoacyl-[acyl-carrier protein] reductase